MLRLDVAKQRGQFHLEVQVDVEPQRPLVLVGESGAGKSTTLEMIAGITRPDGGAIAVDDETWFDGTALDRCVPAHRRSVGYVAQEPTLFPHLSVAQNVAFGLRASGTPARTAVKRAIEALDELGLAALADRRPAGLSGGQRQRVTLARALCLEPRVLLLDEPLSSLDISTKQSMRSEIRRVITQLRCITVYVTHDPLEALTMGDRIAVIEHGRLTQVDDRAGLLRQPRSVYVGRFVGINLFRGTSVERAGGGTAQITVSGGTLYVADAPSEEDIFVAIDPSNITLSLVAPAGSARNVFRGQIAEMTPVLPSGERIRVRLDSAPPLVAEITRSAAESLGLTVGQDVYAAIKATAIATYQ